MNLNMKLFYVGLHYCLEEILKRKINCLNFLKMTQETS